MPLRVQIDKRSCQSSGNCVDAAPEAFVFDEDDLAEPSGLAGRLPWERLVGIARRCPALAIALYTEDGRELETGS